MKRNEGTTDRILRAIAAVAALAVALVVGLGSIAGIVLAVVGIVLGVTAATGFCPIYRVLGLSTCPVRRTSAPREPVRAS
jgi:hypothetical protein